MVHSSTMTVLETSPVPRHVAIIMDGNGRWATQRRLPRTAGHMRGVQAVRRIVEACGRRGVRYLTLFAFSTENWRRPASEVSLLMRLFVRTLEKEADRLREQDVRLRVVGELSAFDDRLRNLITQVEEHTAKCQALTLTIAANYGGRWDILQAMQAMLKAHPDLATQPQAISETLLSPWLAMSYAPEPDLFIRTGGEQRVSNFLIWQLAYTELYFTDCWWPDFNEASLDQAFHWYSQRERRFGRTSAQLSGADA
ncbi:polyprenyl diphosphate synthase [Castellaniella sp.]|uniref:polyprenyl diphosphate synthase n=1 Tax=Castellaniella sp. TaxID=1955812 RepID=UPI0035689039